MLRSATIGRSAPDVSISRTRYCPGLRRDRSTVTPRDAIPTVDRRRFAPLQDESPVRVHHVQPDERAVDQPLVDRLHHQRVVERLALGTHAVGLPEDADLPIARRRHGVQRERHGLDE